MAGKPASSSTDLGTPAQSRRSSIFPLVVVSLMFVLWAIGLFIPTMRLNIKVLQLASLLLCAVLVAGEAAKLRYPLGEHPSKYRSGIVPLNLLDGTRFRSRFTAACFVSAIALICSAMYLIRVDGLRVDTAGQHRALEDNNQAIHYRAQFGRPLSASELAHEQLLLAEASASVGRYQGIWFNPWPLYCTALLPMVWLARWRWLWQRSAWRRENDLCM